MKRVTTRKDKAWHQEHSQALEEEEADLRPGVSDEPYPEIPCGVCDLFFWSRAAREQHLVDEHGYTIDPDMGVPIKPDVETGNEGE